MKSSAATTTTEHDRISEVEVLVNEQQHDAETQTATQTVELSRARRLIKEAALQTAGFLTQVAVNKYVGKIPSVGAAAKSANSHTWGLASAFVGTQLVEGYRVAVDGPVATWAARGRDMCRAMIAAGVSQMINHGIDQIDGHVQKNEYEIAARQVFGAALARTVTDKVLDKVVAPAAVYASSKLASGARACKARFFTAKPKAQDNYNALNDEHANVTASPKASV